MAKLYFYYSAMNAGKSTLLLQSSYNYQERGMDTLLFVPAIDSRFGAGKVTSRIGLTRPAVPFDDAFDFFAHAAAAQRGNSKIRCVLIDEAQFLKKAQVEQLKRITVELGLPVLAYGLRTDFMGEPFEGSKYLLAWAEDLAEIKTICHCGRKAIMTLRIDSQGRVLRAGEQVQIGGNESYVSVCSEHFMKGQPQRAAEVPA
ncbi:MAG: thymidine kinase [Elusimicrobia bacterium]|nr:thymidine kinase [Elusimicrobiota bacterium]